MGRQDDMYTYLYYLCIYAREHSSRIIMTAAPSTTDKYSAQAYKPSRVSSAVVVRTGGVSVRVELDDQR